MRRVGSSGIREWNGQAADWPQPHETLRAGAAPLRPGRLDLDVPSSRRFRPQVFVEILDARRVSRLVSVEGVVDAIEAGSDPRRVRVCEIAVEYRDRDRRSDEHCLTVFVDADTSIYDDSGWRVARSELRVGDRVAVLGRFARDADSRFAITAEVVELGGSAAFLTLTGVVSSCFCETSESIRVDLDAGQGFAEGTVLEVSLAEGTRIFDRTGEELAPEDLEEADRVEVDGVLVLGSGEPDLLRAAVVFVRVAESPEASAAQ